MNGISQTIATGLLAGVTLMALPATAFDRATTNALRLCHDALWADGSDYSTLPNAAISVWPGRFDDTTITVFWHVEWDAPDVRGAGNCVVSDGKVVDLVDFTR